MDLGRLDRDATPPLGGGADRMPAVADDEDICRRFTEGRRIVSQYLAGRPDAILRARMREAEALLAPLAETVSMPGRGALDEPAVQPDEEGSPAISVVLPTFNRSRFVPDAIASVISQRWADWELIVVDDGSEDETEAVVRPFLVDARIRYLRQAHAGACAARNLGLANARAPLVTFLDSDCLFFPGFLAGAVVALRADPNLDFAYGALASQHHGLEDTELLLRPFSRAALATGNYIDTNAMVCRRAAVERIGGFDEGLFRLMDWDLALRLTRTKPARPLQLLAAYYRVVDDIRISDTSSDAIAVARVRGKSPALSLPAACAAQLSSSADPPAPEAPR